MTPLKPGDVLGRYRLERPLGAGGMGSVWIAVQEGLGRRVALKVMHPSIATDAALAARFRQEAEVAASFNHPGIVPVTDFGVDGGRPYLVMDFLAGESLDAVIARDAPLPPHRVAFFAVQVLAALEAMHSRNIVHRDLKPDNIFVSASSGVPDIARLLDFGIARVVEVGGDSKMTTTGQILGTPAYMSPEQAKGMPVTPASDLYALGVVMYEALTGNPPFEAENYHQLLFLIVEGTPAPLSELCPDVDPAFIDLVERAMSPKIESRFASAEEMREALSPFAAMGELRPSQPRAQASVADKSGTDPFAATITPAPQAKTGTDPLAATMASSDTDPSLADSRHDVDAAPPARSISPPSRPPWRWVAAVVALLGVGGAYAAFGGNGGGEIIAENEAVTLAETPPADPPELEQAPLEEGTPEEAAPEEASPQETAPEETETAVDPLPTAESSPTMDAVGAPTSMRSRPQMKMVMCGRNEHPMYLVRPRDRLRPGCDSGGGVLHTSEISALVRRSADALTRCFRGHYINRGQRVNVNIDENLQVTSSLHTFCPVPASVQSCVNGVTRAMDFAGAGASPGDCVYSFDLVGF